MGSQCGCEHGCEACQHVCERDASCVRGEHVGACIDERGLPFFPIEAPARPDLVGYKKHMCDVCGWATQSGAEADAHERDGLPAHTMREVYSGRSLLG